MNAQEVHRLIKLADRSRWGYLEDTTPLQVLHCPGRKKCIYSQPQEQCLFPDLSEMVTPSASSNTQVCCCLPDHPLLKQLAAIVLNHIHPQNLPAHYTRMQVRWAIQEMKDASGTPQPWADWSFPSEFQYLSCALQAMQSPDISNDMFTRWFVTLWPHLCLTNLRVTGYAGMPGIQLTLHATDRAMNNAIMRKIFVIYLTRPVGNTFIHTLHVVGPFTYEALQDLPVRRDVPELGNCVITHTNPVQVTLYHLNSDSDVSSYRMTWRQLMNSVNTGAGVHIFGSSPLHHVFERIIFDDADLLQERKHFTENVIPAITSEAWAGQGGKKFVFASQSHDFEEKLWLHDMTSILDPAYWPGVPAGALFFAKYIHHGGQHRLTHLDLWIGVQVDTTIFVGRDFSCSCYINNEEEMENTYALGSSIHVFRNLQPDHQITAFETTHLGASAVAHLPEVVGYELWNDDSSSVLCSLELTPYMTGLLQRFAVDH
jgi:hypothetical protein